MTLGRVEISGGAILVVALLFYLDRSGAFGAVLLGCLCHEMGHWCAIRALGGRVTALRLTCAGAELRLSAARPLPPGKMLLCALAGPTTNLIIAGASFLLARHGVGEKLYLFAGLNLGLALFNLLPASRLDGGKVLESLLSALGRPEWGRRATALGTAVLALLLTLGGLCLFWESEGRNFTVLLVGVWLTALTVQGEKSEKMLK